MKFDKRISRLLAKSLLVPLGVSCFNFCCVSAMENKSKSNNQKDLLSISSFSVCLKSKSHENLIDALLYIDDAIRSTIDCFAYLGVGYCAPEQKVAHRLANLKGIYNYINHDPIVFATCLRSMIRYYVEKGKCRNKIAALCFLNDDKQFPKFLQERANAYIREKKVVF